MKIAIVGAEAAKFTRLGEIEARLLIDTILSGGATSVISGGCHLGGVDAWAAEIGKVHGLEVIEFLPARRSWSQGYKPRNIKIAKMCDVLHNITVKQLPLDFNGMQFASCYHCGTNEHVKSGGCWTANYAESLGKPAHWHVITNDEE